MYLQTNLKLYFVSNKVEILSFFTGDSVVILVKHDLFLLTNIYKTVFVSVKVENRLVLTADSAEIMLC